jgi:hypothetical protein
MDNRYFKKAATSCAIFWLNRISKNLGFEGFEGEDFVCGGQGDGLPGVVGPGKCKRPDEAGGAVAADGAEKGPHGITGSEDVVDEEAGGRGG